MKRIALGAFALVLCAGLLAGSASAWEPVHASKVVTEGERGRGPGRPGGPGGPGRPGRPGGGWGNRPGYHHGGSGWGWALGAAVGSAIAGANRPSYPPSYYAPSQPTLVCDAYGNCYYRYY